jgi:hypothetical protein
VQLLEELKAAATGLSNDIFLTDKLFANLPLIKSILVLCYLQIHYINETPSYNMPVETN